MRILWSGLADALLRIQIGTTFKSGSVGKRDLSVLGWVQLSEMCSTEQKLCVNFLKFYTSGSRERGSLEFFNSPYVPMSFRFIAMFRKCAFVHIGEIRPPAS